MHRTVTRTARLIAASLAATVAFGVSAPVVHAAPDRGPGVVKVNKGKSVEKQDKGTSKSAGKQDKSAGKQDKSKSAGKHEAKAQRNLVRLSTRTDRALARAIKESRISGLAVIGDLDTKAAVVENVNADRAAVAAATTVAEVKQYRAVNYIHVVNVLRQAAEAQAESDALGGNAEVDALIASAVGKALLVTAESDRSAIKAARAELSAAKELVEAMVPTEELPVEEEPTDAPIDEQPTDAPIEEQPTDAPIEEQPTDAPIEEQPTTEEPTTEPAPVV